MSHYNRNHERVKTRLDQNLWSQTPRQELPRDGLLRCAVRHMYGQEKGGDEQGQSWTELACSELQPQQSQQSALKLRWLLQRCHKLRELGCCCPFLHQSALVLGWP